MTPSPSMSPGGASARSPGRRANWPLRIVLGALAVLVALVLASLLVLIFGAASGEEFSPDTFQRRRFSYQEVPFFRTQITSVSQYDVSGALEKHLLAEKLLPATPANASTTWHMVSQRHGASAIDGLDPSVLITYLEASDGDGKLVWLEWTKQSPELAKIFWPAVAELAAVDMYLALPDLFSLARSSDDMVEFSKALDSLVATKCLEWGELRRRDVVAARSIVALGLRRAAADDRFRPPLERLQAELDEHKTEPTPAAPKP